MDASWTNGLSAGNATECDPLRELCQSYVFAELLDAAGKVALPGFSIAEAEVIAGVDGSAVPLKWNNSSPAAEGWRAHVCGAGGSSARDVSRRSDLFAWNWRLMAMLQEVECMAVSALAWRQLPTSERWLRHQLVALRSSMVWLYLVLL